MNNEDTQSFSSWINDVGYGNYADHESIPIVYEGYKDDDNDDDGDDDHDHDYDND